MHKTRIVFFGARGRELTSRHLEVFLSSGANIIGFVEVAPGATSTDGAEGKPYEEIDQAAARLNIPILSPQSPKNPDFIESLKRLKPDAFIIACCQFYLPREVLGIPPRGAINFHTSLLPRHAGKHPGFWAIWYGDRESGMVVHYMDDGIDTGDIIYETRVPIERGDTVDDLYNRIWNTSTLLIEPLLENLDAGTLPRKKQDKSTYHYNYDITEKDYELDFRQPAEVLYGRVKMSPKKFYFILDGEKYYVRDCSVVYEHVQTRKFRMGMPFSVDGKLVFATPRKYLRITGMVKNDIEVDPCSLDRHKFRGKTNGT